MKEGTQSSQAKNADKGERKIFKAMSPRAFEHEADRAALAGLRNMTGFESLLKKVVGTFGEKRMRLLFLANAVRINERQNPDLYHTFLEACEILDLDTVPELYVTQSPDLNAMAVGIDQPFVVVNSAMVKSCSQEELRCVLGHEAGHILSGHALYRTMLVVLLRTMQAVMPRAIIMMALPILLALQEWSRKSELSADRAGLLVSQDLEVSYQVCLKMAGGGDISNYNLEEFEKQAEEYDQEGTGTDTLFKCLNLMWFSHPFPVLRILEIKKWYASEQYRQILDGDYPHRTEYEESDMKKDIREGVEIYRGSVTDGKESLNSFVEDALGTGGDFFQDVSDFLREKKETYKKSAPTSKV